MNSFNGSQKPTSTVSGARKGPKDDEPALLSINSSFFPPNGLVGLPEVPSPRGGASNYRNPNPEAVPAKSFNYNHKSLTSHYRGSDEHMDNINDDPKPFVPPISPEILQTSAKDEHERLIKWELSAGVNLQGSETYRTNEEKQPASSVPKTTQDRDKSDKSRQSVSFDIPKEPSAPPLSPEPPTVTGKPPISPRPTCSQQPRSFEIRDMYNNNADSPSVPPQSTNVNVGTEERSTDEFNFGRMRFRQVGVSIESVSNSGGDERVPTPPSAPKPTNQNVTMDEQNGGKVRRQWQRDSNELVIVTQNESVSPRSESTTVQAPTNRPNQQCGTSDTTLQPSQPSEFMQKKLAMLQLFKHEFRAAGGSDPEGEAMFQSIEQELQLQLQSAARGSDRGRVANSENYSVAEATSRSNAVGLQSPTLTASESTNSDHEAKRSTNSVPSSRYLQDLHDIFDSCDKIEAKLANITGSNGNQKETADLSTIKETASKIVGNVIARAISEEERRKNVDEPGGVFDVIKERKDEADNLHPHNQRVGNNLNSLAAKEKHKGQTNNSNNQLDLMNDERVDAEFLERQETPTTVPDTDEDAAAKAEILNLEISNGINRFISSVGGVEQGTTRSSSQASSQPAEVPPEELSETSHDDLEDRLKLIRQESFIRDSIAEDPSAQELEQKLKNIRKSFERKLSLSKEELQREASIPTESNAVSAYQQLYPSEQLIKFYDQRESEEKKPDMLRRSDSGITSGSQALQHIEETIKLREMRAERRQQSEEEMSIMEQMNMVAYGSVDERRNSANSVGGSEASSVRSGPISQPLSVETRHVDCDWSCRRYKSL